MSHASSTLPESPLIERLRAHDSCRCNVSQCLCHALVHIPLTASDLHVLARCVLQFPCVPAFHSCAVTPLYSPQGHIDTQTRTPARPQIYRATTEQPTRAIVTQLTRALSMTITLTVTKSHCQKGPSHFCQLCFKIRTFRCWLPSLLH